MTRPAPVRRTRDRMPTHYTKRQGKEYVPGTDVDEEAGRSVRVEFDVTSESLDRIERQDLAEAEVAPLGRQGKCPVCFLELPLTRICDDHGRVG